jgi:REP element-mobilizing transposase RayT
MRFPLLRNFVCGRTYFIYQRTSRSQLLFHSDDDRYDYLALLFRLARRCRVRVHAYCLLADHVRLLLEPRLTGAIPYLMQQLQSIYARAVHARLGVRGHLWQGKYGAQEVTRAQFRATVRAIEMQPVRDGWVRSATQYRWSSARHHAAGRERAERLGLNRIPDRPYANIELTWKQWDASTDPEGWACDSPAFAFDPQAWRFRFGPWTLRSRAGRSIHCRYP